MPSAEQMEMYMVDRLAAFGIAIRHEPEPSIGNALVFGYLVRNLEQMTDEVTVCLIQVKDGRDMLLGYDKCMDRRLGIYILKCEGDFIFIDYLRRYLS